MLKKAILPALFALGALVLGVLRCVNHFPRHGFFFWMLVIPCAAALMLLHVLVEAPLRKKRVLYVFAVLLNFMGALSILCVLKGIIPSHAEREYLLNPYVLAPYYQHYAARNIFLLIAYVAAMVLFITAATGDDSSLSGASVVMGICFLVAAILTYNYEKRYTTTNDLLYNYLPRLLLALSFITYCGVGDGKSAAERS